MKLTPKNWEKFQHYKDRCPPWIKLHRDLLNDRAFMSLPTASKALAPLMWMLASESKSPTGEFDGSTEELEFRLRIPAKDIESGRKSLIDKGFFVVASGVLADCKQPAIPEGEGEGEAKREVEADYCPEPQSDSSPAVISIPLVDKSDFHITEQQLGEWSGAYPGVDVLQQLRSMRQWCMANTAQRKTRRGIGAFVVRWLSKEQDKSRPGMSQAATETGYARSMREKYEVVAPSIAARAPGAVKRIDPNSFFDDLPYHSPQEISHG